MIAHHFFERWGRAGPCWGRLAAGCFGPASACGTLPGVGALVMAAVPALERTTFRTSRLLEFCSRKELDAQTGHGRRLATDGRQGAGRQRARRLRGSRHRAGDPGDRRPWQDPGARQRPRHPARDRRLDPGLLTRTSSREAYVAPDRGAQGNALKTILAMPFALNGEEGRVEIVARGIRHAITFRVDRIAQPPVIDHRAEAASVRTGTSITVHWPTHLDQSWSDAREQIFTDRRGLSPSSTRICPDLVWRDRREAGAEHVAASGHRPGRLAEVDAVGADLPALVQAR